MANFLAIKKSAQAARLSWLRLSKTLAIRIKMKPRDSENRNGKEDDVVGVGWYEESQWDLLLKHAVDKEDLEPTYSDYVAGLTESIENLTKIGLKVERIPLDIKQMIKRCKERGYIFDGESRSVYISLKIKGKIG